MKRSLGTLVGRGGAFLSNSLPASARHNKYISLSTTNGCGYSTRTFPLIQTSPFLHSPRCTYFGENPRTIHCKAEEEAKGGCSSDSSLNITTNFTKKGEEIGTVVTRLEKGDVVNLSDLLFTKERDYLIRCNDGQRVKAEHLAGKVVAIYFDSLSDINMEHMTSLMHIYNDLQPKNCLEVVFVNVDDVFDSSSSSIQSQGPHQSDPQKHLENVFSCMPWTAIPLSDITLRKHLIQISGPDSEYGFGNLFIIDSVGKVLQCNAEYLIPDYGAAGYPFSDERINFLNAEEDAIARQPSLETLLASPERDYLITNKMEKVPIHNLVHKTVALYFYVEGVTDESTTLKIKQAYEELKKYHENFEIVLIYLHDIPYNNNVNNEETFWKNFKTMPWLAIPFRDSNLKKLTRIFAISGDDDMDMEPTLVIIGPDMEFIEPFGLSILLHFNISAYPFSREKIAKLVTDKAKELKLDMLWDPNSVFGGKDGSQVGFSQFAGKRVLIFFQWTQLQGSYVKFLKKLEESYIHMKGTDDEFEVIHINSEYSNDIKDVATLPWSVHTLDEGDEGYSRARDLFDFNSRSFSYSSSCSIIAFGRDGRLVRKAMVPTFEDTDFPFYAGGLEKEALIQLVAEFKLDRLHYFHPGRIYSFKRSYEEVFSYFDSRGLYYSHYEHLRPVNHSSTPASPLSSHQTICVSVPSAWVAPR